MLPVGNHEETLIFEIRSIIDEFKDAFSGVEETLKNIDIMDPEDVAERLNNFTYNDLRNELLSLYLAIDELYFSLLYPEED